MKIKNNRKLFARSRWLCQRQAQIYKNYSEDQDFRLSLETSIIRILETALNNPNLDLLASYNVRSVKRLARLLECRLIN
ncbi:MAG: hypothetical protein NW214_13235 [Pseudanabaenaceae cyanobacterium bins.39]|nr:hypothetical protein [Pseudanabaenaceae cyanobacterium bins.39]